jgi:pimeloyl-ACP methyl ester carboxylesterase
MPALVPEEGQDRRSTHESIVNGIPVQFVEHGSGTPVLGLHGVDVDHREMAGSLEPLFADRPGYRRIYPDLPGMGRTPHPTPSTAPTTSWTSCSG